VQLTDSITEEPEVKRQSLTVPIPEIQVRSEVESEIVTKPSLTDSIPEIDSLPSEVKSTSQTPSGKSIDERIKELEDVLKGLTGNVRSLKRKNNNYKKREKELVKTIVDMKQILGNINSILPKKTDSTHKDSTKRKEETPRNDNKTNETPKIDTPQNI